MDERVGPQYGPAPTMPAIAEPCLNAFSMQVTLIKQIWGASRRSCTLGTLHRGISSSGVAPSSEDAYLEEWQRKQIKSPEFYAKNAERRHWFVTVDLQGRLFLEESPVKTIATCLKDEKFLDFFWRNIKTNDSGLHQGYPFLSVCGKELSFILPADQPVVFHDLAGGSLIYGATLRVPFDPSKLLASSRTGRLYHALVGHRSGLRVGLIRSAVAQTLFNHIELVGTARGGEDPMSIRWQGHEHRIGKLPDEDEPMWGAPAPPE